MYCIPVCISLLLCFLTDGCMVRLLSAKGSVVSSLPSLSKLGSGRKREINIIESLTGTVLLYIRLPTHISSIDGKQCI